MLSFGIFCRDKFQCPRGSLKLLKRFQVENVLILKGVRFDQTIVFRKKRTWLRQTVRYFRNIEKSLIRFRGFFDNFKNFSARLMVPKNQMWHFMLAKHFVPAKILTWPFPLKKLSKQKRIMPKHLRRSTKSPMVSTRLEPSCSCCSNLGIRT